MAGRERRCRAPVPGSLTRQPSRWSSPALRSASLSPDRWLTQRVLGIEPGLALRQRGVGSGRSGGPPDAVTDAYTRWEPILAGHRDLRPLVHSHKGTPLAAPLVDLDPTHPTVCLAHVDGDAYGSQEPGWDGRLALVVQAVEGIQVWLQHFLGWTMVPGPEGTLRAARFGYNEKRVAWVVTDGRLCVADLSAIGEALPGPPG